MTDKIFKAYDVRATYPTPLNEEAAWKVGHATAQYLWAQLPESDCRPKSKLENTLVVGQTCAPVPAIRN